MVFHIQIVTTILRIEIISKFFIKNLPSGFILDDLLKYYFIKISSVIIKKEIINFHKFDSFYNIIGKIMI